MGLNAFAIEYDCTKLIDNNVCYGFQLWKHIVGEKF